MFDDKLDQWGLFSFRLLHSKNAIATTIRRRLFGVNILDIVIYLPTKLRHVPLVSVFSLSLSTLIREATIVLLRLPSARMPDRGTQATIVIPTLAIDTFFLPYDRSCPALAYSATSKASRSIVTATRDRISCPVLQRMAQRRRENETRIESLDLSATPATA